MGAKDLEMARKQSEEKGIQPQPPRALPVEEAGQGCEMVSQQGGTERPEGGMEKEEVD